MVLICFAANKKRKALGMARALFLQRYNQIYPEKPLRLFGVLVLMLAVRRE